MAAAHGGDHYPYKAGIYQTLYRTLYFQIKHFKDLAIMFRTERDTLRAKLDHGCGMDYCPECDG